MKLTQNALEVLKSRYLWHQKSRGYETPEELFQRVAKAVAPTASLRKRFFEMMAGLEFLPNSPTLMNAGKKHGQLAACFVLPLPDDLAGIMDTLKLTALIHQSGGGTGFSFSDLRPRFSEVSTSLGAAAGPVGFLNLFNQLTETIKQGGLRRGANMGILSVEHPDIEAFIDCKNDVSQIRNFNLSVGVTDKFMKAVKNDTLWALKDPHTGKQIKTLKAQDLFKKIAKNAWQTGEPGIIFLDAINKQNPTPKMGPISATNPCGEQPLLPYEACNLGSINLNAIVQNGKINFDKLAELVELSVIFLDRVIDICHYPDPRITEVVRANRKIGLGVMGFHDLLIQMNIPYGSDESFKCADQVMSFIRNQAIEVSQGLAKSKGPFKNFNSSLWKKRGARPLRNATLTTIAPTGTISLIAGASPGIEPVFSYVFERHILDDQRLFEMHPLFENAISSLSNRDQIISETARLGSLQSQNLPDKIKSIYLTARDIAPEAHVRMQAHFQKHSDSAVSKTINLPKSATVEEVEAAFMLAFDLKCKGITAYRDQSRPNQAMQLMDCPDCTKPL